MARPHPPPPDLDVTIAKASDLKNVNWQHGDLRPYVVAWIDPSFKVTTKVDDCGDTDPCWDDKFALPVTKRLEDAELTIEIYHDKPSDPDKALVGRATLCLMEVADAGGFDEKLDFTLKLKRPSGRPHGKIEVSVRLKERRMPAYSSVPVPYDQGYYAPPPPPSDHSRDWQQYPGYSSPYPSAYPGQAPPQPYYPQSYAPPSGYTGYSYAPPEPPYGAPPMQQPGYSQAPYYGSAGYGEAPKSGSKFGGLGTGLAVGALAGAVGGLALGEYVQHEKNEASEDQADQDAERYQELEAAQEGGQNDYYDGGDGYGDDY